MTKKAKNIHTGSSFDDWLKEESIYEEVTAESIQWVERQLIMKNIKRKLTSKMTRKEHAEEVERLKAEVKKAKANYEGWKETLHLLSSYENAKRLLKSMEELDADKGIEMEIEG